MACSEMNSKNNKTKILNTRDVLELAVRLKFSSYNINMLNVNLTSTTINWVRAKLEQQERATLKKKGVTSKHN